MSGQTGIISSLPITLVIPNRFGNKPKPVKYLILLFLLSGISQLSYAQDLTVTVTGVRSAEGHIRLGFYYTEKDWKAEKSNLQRVLPKSSLRNGTVTVKLTDVPAGVYAVACVDDENDSGLMDWGMLMPKEGFGFSNYYHKGISRPSFDKFKFTHGPGATSITMPLRYM